MIKKTKSTIWQSGHAHHDSRRMLLKQGMWECVNKRHIMERSEEISPDDALSPYSAEVVKLFRHAIRRCPSVSIDADIMEGQPCIAGTRIPVRAILRAIEQYGSVKGATVCYPQLTIEQVEDAVYFSQVVLELPGGLDETTVAT